MRTTKMFLLLLFPLILLTPGPAPSIAADTPETLELPPLVLAQGEQRLIKLAQNSDVKKFTLGSPIVRSLKSSAEHILLKGVSPGITDLWVWKSDGSTEHRKIRVEKLNPGDLSSPLERALSDLTETEVIFNGRSVLLRGTIQTLKESTKVTFLTEQFPKEVIDQTELGAKLLEKGQNLLRDWIDKNKYSTKIRIETEGRSLWVRGHIELAQTRTELVRQLHAIFPPAKIIIDALPDEAPTIHFKVFLLELKRTRFSALGITWPGGQEGAFRVTTGGIQNLLALDLALQALEGEGSARILSNPELVVRAPGDAELFAGGEIPIQIKTKFGSTVTWKNHGLTLQLKVSHSTGELVRLDIFTEVSHLDPSTSIENIPGIAANRMKTQVDARYGVPLLLSGLLQQGMREQARGLPWLRRIPILGVLFGSEDYLSEKSELVAILLPSLAPPSTQVSRIQDAIPKGPTPLPRDWLSPEEQEKLKADPDYPWNVLQ
ncbi:hypothetical protein WDW86_08840 [Bdellovibrionota bacterium FG-2]